MPRRTVRHERIPALRPPPLGDPVPLQHQMRHAVAGQMFADRDPGLARADDKRID
jgi:hypothetical protein